MAKKENNKKNFLANKTWVDRKKAANSMPEKKEQQTLYLSQYEGLRHGK